MLKKSQVVGFPEVVEGFPKVSPSYLGILLQHVTAYYYYNKRLDRLYAMQDADLRKLLRLKVGGSAYLKTSRRVRDREKTIGELLPSLELESSVLEAAGASLRAALLKRDVLESVQKLLKEEGEPMTLSEIQESLETSAGSPMPAILRSVLETVLTPKNFEVRKTSHKRDYCYASKGPAFSS